MRRARPAQLSAQGLFYVIRQRAEAAEIALCSPHDHRRSYSSDLLDASAHTLAVQQVAGHAQVTTTQR